MRFATWRHEGATRSGVVTEAGVHAFVAPATVLDVVALGLPAAVALGTRTVDSTPATPIDQVRLLPPLDPPTVRDFAAFEEHVEGALRAVGARNDVPPEWYEAPAFYFTNPYALIGAHDDVPVPPGCTAFDFELEVAAVVSGRGTSVTPERADALLFGYTILNDWSARDIQTREMRVGLGPAKAKDTATTLGPWLVTRDELDGDLDADGFLALEMSVSVNGTVVGEDLLSNMSWTFPELVAHAARGTSVRSGDVLGSGTCGNGGCLAELRGDHAWLRPGDVVEMTVEGLGTIRNRVVAGAASVPVPAARVRPRNRRHAGGFA